MLGRHPVSNVALVSTARTSSKLIGQGNNRADSTFIPNDVVPFIILFRSDFPELKRNRPSLRYEKEQVNHLDVHPGR